MFVAVLLLFTSHAAVLDALESRGVLQQLRARIRSEVFAALDDEVVEIMCIFKKINQRNLKVQSLNQSTK